MNKDFLKKLKKFSIISLVIILIAEIFIFNYKSFLINPFNSSEYSHQIFQIGDAEMSGLTSVTNNVYEVITDNPTITFSMDSPVETMYFDASEVNDTTHELKTDILYATESHKDFKTSNKSFSLINVVPNSKYVTCSYFGNVYRIQLKINAEANTRLMINGFEINKKIPFHFSIMRILFLFLLCILIFTLSKYPSYREGFDLNRRSHKYAAGFTLGAFLCLIVFTYNMDTGDYNWSKLTYGNQMTQELVDAFEHGQVSLMDEVPKELLELENPYDTSERSAAGLSYKWDHLLFEGKYYSYYGIAPVITLFLPYHMITGYYFPSSLACLMYTLLAGLFLGLCYISIVKNWFAKTPLRLVILGLVTTLFASCVIINVYATQFYEIAQSSAMCFLVIGFYFMLNSGIFTKNNIRLSFLLLSSLFVSLSVLSRATSAVYAIVMVFWIIYGYFQYMEGKNKKSVDTAKYILTSITPYVIFGLVQMTYNYLRFGNPFDFGIKYTLTIYDYINIDMHFSMIMVSLINFLFAVPLINTTFPFIHGNFDSLNVNGYYFVATKPTFGVFPSVLPVLSLLYAPKIYRQFHIKEKIKFALIWFVPGILFPIILAAMTWEYGYAMRYNADFGWQMSLAAFVVIFYVYNRIDNTTIRKWLFRVLLTATAWCVICYTMAIFTSNPIDSVSHNVNGAELYYKIKNLIAFWN